MSVSIVLILLFLPDAFAFASSIEAQSASKRSATHTNRKDYEAAIKTLRQALKSDPSDTKLAQQLSDAYRQQSFELQSSSTGDIERALREQQLALYIRPKSWVVQLELYQLLRSMGQDPDQPKTHLALAQQAFARGEFLPAIVEARLAVGLKGSSDAQDILQESIKRRLHDAAYFPGLDYPRGDLLHDSQLLISKADECRTKKYFTVARAFIDEAMSGGFSQLANDAAQRLQSDEESQITEFRSLAQKAQDHGDSRLARHYYGRILALRRDDLATLSQVRALDAKVKALPSPELSRYVGDLEKNIKRNWKPGHKLSYSDGVTVVFCTHNNGSITDVVVLDPLNANMLTDSCMNAITSTKAAPMPEGSPPVLEVQFSFNYNVQSAFRSRY